jgi:hypothetical protein
MRATEDRRHQITVGLCPEEVDWYQFWSANEPENLRRREA